MKMFELLNQYKDLLHSPIGIFQLVVSAIISLAVLVIFVSVLINFFEADNARGVAREKKSIVETGSMTLFFLIYYVIIRLRIGIVALSQDAHIVLIVVGLLLIIVGCVVNVLGRFNLGKNWANQIKVYNDHSLVRGGVYKFVRHPLYASLIWMFFGGSLVEVNYLAFLSNILIFIPLMYYRAKQEERELSLKFKEYQDYRKNVWMFFPKF